MSYSMLVSATLFERFALKTLKKLNIKPKSLRVDTTLDTTSFHVDGQYDVEEDRACVRLEHGYRWSP